MGRGRPLTALPSVLQAHEPGAIRGAIWLGTRGRASCCLHWLHLILLGWFLTWPSHLSLPLCKVGTPKLTLPVLKAEQTQRMRKCLGSTFY